MPIITRLKRVGRFQVHISVIDKGRRDQLEKLFGKLIITRAEMILHSGCIDYVAICDDFEPIDPGSQVPFYTWEFTGDKWVVKKTEENFFKLDKK